ncbi:MAG: hypothetical protein PHC84_04410 [Clostridia bacterium]|nr:hypothetical protein [Clostridia bacterium]
MTKKKILIIVLICTIVPVLAFMSLSVTTYALYKAEKKTVIILPGLFASGLYDSATGEGVWDPFEGLDISFSEITGDAGLNMGKLITLLMEDSVQEQLDKLLANDAMGASDSLFNMMAMNEDGTAAVETIVRVPWEKDTRLKYGVVNAQKDMYDSLNAQFGAEYEVQVFNYDFRMDNRQNAVLLENYINENDYDDVILVSHSNGGQVAGVYLARSAENRARVSKYISYNSPYYGSFSAITILENTTDMISGLVEKLIANSLIGLANNVETVFTNQFMKLLNIWTAYQLLPSYELFASEYHGEQAAICIDGEPVSFLNQEELWDFYCSRPWAKDSQGNLRPVMQQWLAYKDSLTVTLDSGEKVLSTTLVDTTYFAGTEVLTVNKAYYVTEGDGIAFESSGTTLDGDGTVLLSSAVGMLEDESKICYVPGVDHYGVNIKYYQAAAEATNDFVSKSIENKSVWYKKIWRKILY